MHIHVERYKSNEFIEIYRVWQEKVKNLTWKSKKPNFSGFLGFSKKPSFLKWVSTALFQTETDADWITDIVWPDDNRLLQESNLTARQPWRPDITLYI